MYGRIDFVIPECYVDTNLVETLVCHAGCNHQKGCNQVAKVMQQKFGDRFAVGIVDADKRVPSYLDEFNIVAQSEHIRLFAHPKRPHYILTITPAIDGFILACAAEVGVDMKDYGLPSKLSELTAHTKNVLSNKDSRFKQLFKALESSCEIRIMKTVLQYLTANTYQTDRSTLRSLF